jgi:hypothetical protein
MELFIPKIYALEIVRFYHFFNGHPGVDKLVKRLKLRYQFPNGYSIMDMANRVKRGCVIYKACEHPNWAMKGRYDITPIPEAPLTSICVDIFTLSETVWQNNTYDALVLFVDRQSGWMIAQLSNTKD